MSDYFKIESFFIEQYDRGGLGSKASAVIKLGEKVIRETNLEGIHPGTVIGNTIVQLHKSFSVDLDLKQLAYGTTRTVYRIDDDHILKLAKNYQGLTSNQTEMASQKGSYFYRYTPKVFYISPNGYFIISESVNTINDSDFPKWLQAIDIPDWMKDPEVFELVMFVLYRANQSPEESSDFLLSELKEELEELLDEVLSDEQVLEMSKEILESNFVLELLRLMSSSDSFSFSRTMNDILPQNVGFNYEGLPVILDHG